MFEPVTEIVLFYNFLKIVVSDKLLGLAGFTDLDRRASVKVMSYTGETASQFLNTASCQLGVVKIAAWQLE